MRSILYRYESIPGLCGSPMNDKLFDTSKPIEPQIIELAEYLKFPDESIQEIKKQLAKKDLDTTMGIIQHLSFLFIGESILKGVQDG